MLSEHTQKQASWFSALRIAPWLAAVFLCAQILATAHSATIEHLHDGVPCIVAAASKQYDAMDTPPPVFVKERKTVRLPMTAAAYAAKIGTTLSAFSIRGPPALS